MFFILFYARLCAFFPSSSSASSVSVGVAPQTLLAYDARTGALLPGQAPAPKRVVEHIVFERRLWYDLPWVAKDRLFADA